MQKNKLIWIAGLIVVILAGAYFAWSRNMFSGQKNQQNKSVSRDNQNQSEQAVPSPSSSIAQENAGVPDNSELSSPDEKRSDEKPDENFRQQVMAYVNQNLNKLAAPPANDKWDVPTFYFVGNSNVYVELYAVDTDLAGAKMLYKGEKDSSGNIKLTEAARYKEGEEDWILSSGQDNYDNYVMEEYDLNDKTNKWEKTDEFTDESDSGDGSGAVDNSDTGSTAGQIIR